MGRGFVIYLLSCIITLAFGIIFSNVFILFLFFIFLLAPIVSKILMKIDADNTEIKIYSLSDAIQGSETLFYLDINSRNQKTLAQGLLYLTLEITYQKYGEVRKRRLKVPVSRKQGTIKITTAPDLCSVISVKCVSAQSEDMLGIIRSDLTPPPTFYFTAFPKQLPISIIGINRSLISSYSEASQMSKKGNDLTDIQEFKDYIPGDSVKAIHWKLSSKLERTLIKVGSNSTSLNTLVFINPQRTSHSDNPEAENRLLCASLQLGFTVSVQLIESGISHKICSVGDDGLEFYDIYNYEDEITAQRDILASPVSSKENTGINRLLFEKGIDSYSKIICICNESNTDETKKLLEFCDTTTLVISPNTQVTKTTLSIGGKIIELPFDNIQTNRYSIEI